MSTEQLLEHHADPQAVTTPALDPPPGPRDLAALNADDWQGWDDGAYVLAYLVQIGLA